MAVPREIERKIIPIDTKRNLRLIPHEPAEAELEIGESRQTTTSFSPIEFLEQALSQLTPEAINKLYIVKRPAAIDHRNELLKTRALLISSLAIK